MNLVSPELTLAPTAVGGELRGIMREIFSMNYQKSLTLAFNMAAENHAQQQVTFADIEEYRLHMKNQFLAEHSRPLGAPVQPRGRHWCPKDV
jgi:hypothetical protein